MENAASILFCLTLIYSAVTTRILSCISVLSAQGILLAFIVAAPALGGGGTDSVIRWHAIVVAGVSLVIKTIAVPLYLRRLLFELEIRRFIESYLQPFHFVLILIGVILTLFGISHWLHVSTAEAADVPVIPFASGFSAVIAGILTIVFRRKLITHVIGFLIMENGIFLLGVTIARDMPAIVELGSLLDVFVVVFLMGIAINRLRSTFSVFDTAGLGRVRD